MGIVSLSIGLALLAGGATDDGPTGLSRLTSVVGRWEVEYRWPAEPGGAPKVSHGRCDTRFVLGDRFVREETFAEDDGRPFQASSILGFDEVDKKFVWTWIDSRSSGTFRVEGQCETSSPICKFAGPWEDPATGRREAARWVLRLKGAAGRTIEIWTGSGKTERRRVEIVYSAAEVAEPPGP